MPGFRRQLRRVRRLLLLACHVPRLPRLVLGLRFRLQLLVRLSTLWRCGCHVSSFQFVPACADAQTFSVEHAVFAEPHRGYATGCCVRRTGRDRPLLPQCYPEGRKLVDQTGIEPVTS